VHFSLVALLIVVGCKHRTFNTNVKESNTSAATKGEVALVDGMTLDSAFTCALGLRSAYMLGPRELNLFDPEGQTSFSGTNMQWMIFLAPPGSKTVFIYSNREFVEFDLTSMEEGKGKVTDRYGNVDWKVSALLPKYGGVQTILSFHFFMQNSTDDVRLISASKATSTDGVDLSEVKRSEDISQSGGRALVKAILDASKSFLQSPSSAPSNKLVEIGLRQKALKACKPTIKPEALALIEASLSESLTTLRSRVCANKEGVCDYSFGLCHQADQVLHGRDSCRPDC
jgi:hypothetical protein